MQLISCQNSFKINRKHQNNILTVATGMITVIIPVATVIIVATGMMTSPCLLLMRYGNIRTKMDAQVASKLHFRCFTYAQKDN
jgi:hypothetical protein